MNMEEQHILPAQQLGKLLTCFYVLYPAACLWKVFALACTGPMLLMSVDVQQICYVQCLAHCATGSIRLALSISGVHTAKRVYRLRCDLARAALQVLQYLCVCVFVCKSYCLPCQGSCLVASIQSCSSVL